MTRPCFLIVDREYGGTISSRKLVLETAKLNVITAYSGGEALDTLRRFSGVDGVVLNASVPDMPCSGVVSGLKKIAPSMTVIVIGTPAMDHCDGSDYFLDSFEPQKLLTLLTSLSPRVAEVRAAEEERIRRERE